jgi:DDE superfamily endonuclease
MRCEQIKHLKGNEFKRLTDVTHQTFSKMLVVYEASCREFGRPSSLTRANQVLMTLMYWREYRTEFHIGVMYGVSEATVCRTIQKVENALIQSKAFHLPGKKVLQASNLEIEMVLIDVTEQTIERPKKDSAGITAGKRSGTPTKHR